MHLSLSLLTKLLKKSEGRDNKKLIKLFLMQFKLQSSVFTNMERQKNWKKEVHKEVAAGVDKVMNKMRGKNKLKNAFGLRRGQQSLPDLSILFFFLL